MWFNLLCVINWDSHVSVQQQLSIGQIIQILSWTCKCAETFCSSWLKNTYQFGSVGLRNTSLSRRNQFHMHHWKWNGFSLKPKCWVCYILSSSFLSRIRFIWIGCRLVISILAWAWKWCLYDFKNLLLDWNKPLSHLLPEFIYVSFYHTFPYWQFHAIMRW